ncbi:hypothetical protein XM38_044230 [Halomicronema hongdechloris C2206]|uniref:DUF2203 domain-containing protein n=1 Tax=Halomicronema hongdechloris C2206 TaxID=1641165 RepID=A0A1Z3HT63_9CYAN|nr:hypothetical protein [Halomicronema hongdechloris]ASC73456.1 hypothetical protein XM38_044230 [Halomicronema hongdechloris C2206]
MPRPSRQRRADSRRGSFEPASSEVVNWDELAQRLQMLLDHVNQLRALQQHQGPIGTEDMVRTQQRLAAIEADLASQLWSWRQLQEPFWQAVRFGGLGLIVGWVLRSWAG